MRIAHFARFAPHCCGQYETVRDLIWAEKLAKIEAVFIDGENAENIEVIGKKDSWLEVQSIEAAYDADLLIQHSVIPLKIRDRHIPYLIALHGRPENSFRLEQSGKMRVLSLVASKYKNDKDCKGFICFWKEHIPFWKALLPGANIYYITPPINTYKFKPDGKKVKFKVQGTPNLVIADIWREDRTPFNVIFAANYYRETYNKSAKLYIYGMPNMKWKNFLIPLVNNGFLPEIHGLTRHLDEVYRSGDILVTPNIIATRVIREALSSGMSIVAPHGCAYTKFTADPRHVDKFAKQIHYCWRWMLGHDDSRKELHDKAKRYWDVSATGRAMKDILREVLP